MSNVLAPVKCQGVTRKGKQCSKLAIEGAEYCHQHQVIVAEKKLPNPPKPDVPEHILLSLIGAVTTNQDVDVTEVNFPDSIDEIISPKIKAVESKAKEMIKNEVAIVEPTAEEMIKQHPHLLVNVSEQFLKGNKELVSLMIQEATSLSDEGIVKESAATTDIINELSMQLKDIRMNATMQHGTDIPESIQKDIKIREEDIFILQQKKAILLIVEDSIISDEEEIVVEDKPSLFSKFLAVFKSFVAKNSGQLAIAVLLAVMFAVLAIGESNFPDSPSVDKPNVSVPDKPAAEKVSPPVITPDAESVVPVNTYTVQDGDTLWDIAEKVYGDGTQWTKIYSANSDLIDDDDSRNADSPGHWIHAGQSLTLPLEGGDNIVQ